MNRIVKEGDLFESMKEQLRQLPWMLIFILALIQLTRPILSTAGFFDNFRPQGPIIATAFIALIWIGVAVVRSSVPRAVSDAPGSAGAAPGRPG
jgi:hypothetical protein